MPVTPPAVPPGYPREWEADVLLSDGGTSRLRPIRPDDAAMLVDFYDRVSPESKYLRFFAPYPRLSQRDVARFTQVDYVDRVAFILTVGEQMIGVGRYDRLEDDRAEVAFLVEDAHQGRGVAQLLLEHLAEAARERGITAFVAEILPENRRMAQVFVDAGYRVSKDFDDGVLVVEFPILPTDTSVGVMERREHRAEGLSMERLLNPRRVVVQGPGERVQALVSAVLRGGFRGSLHAVSTDDVAVWGVPTSPSVAVLEGRIDLAVLSIPTNQLGGAVIDAAHKGAHGLVLLAGSSQRGDDAPTVISLARAYGVRALGPDALGLINTDPDVALNASPGPMPRPGSVGLFCQSAAVGVSLLNLALRLEVGVSSFISTGDYADVTGNDVMQYWEDDVRTRVCLLALDSIGNPRKFSRIARRLARRKPIVIVSPGRAQRSWTAPDTAVGHASPVDALFRQAGVIVVRRRQAMFDIAKIVARQPLPSGPRTTVITNSSSLARRLAHTVTSSGLLLGDDPVVLDATGSPELFAEAARRALAEPDCDAVVCGVLGVFGRHAVNVRSQLERVAAISDKPVIGVVVDFDDVEALEPAAEGPDVLGTLPWFDSGTDAINALSAVAAHAHWRERDPGAVPLIEVDEDAAKRLVNRILAVTPQGRPLTEDECAELLGYYGIRLVRRRCVTTLDEAVGAGEEFGWDVVLKAGSSLVRGRPDVAGVYRNLDGPDEMLAAWEDLERLVNELEIGEDRGRLAGLSLAQPVVQPMVPAGVPLVVSSREDRVFGPILSLGLDGIASELLGDTVYRVPPLTTVDAAAMVRDLRAAPELFGRNGKPGVDVGGVETLLHRVAQLADLIPHIATLTLSPCLASRHLVSVLGAQIEVAPMEESRDPLARTLD
ncbi:MAG: GNAT family N-acetyltransferase [Propionibacteriaceae bacterium]